MKKEIWCALSGMLLLAGGVSQAYAASVSYNLTLSSDDLTHVSGTGFVTGNIPNGNTYATVTIDDMGTPGLINFTVALSPYWSGKADTGFGIDSFGFNVLPPEAVNGLTSGDIFNINGGDPNWGAVVDYTGPPGPVGIAQNGFGKFDAVVSTMGAANRIDPLTFSIDNAFSVDVIADYIAGSIAGDNGSNLFAAHIAGFTDQNPLPPGGTCPGTPDANIEDCNLLTSVWVGGGTAVVPVPAAVWLFGSGLIGLVGVARRKRV